MQTIGKNIQFVSYLRRTKPRKLMEKRSVDGQPATQRKRKLMKIKPKTYEFDSGRRTKTKKKKKKKKKKRKRPRVSVTYFKPSKSG